MQGDETQKAFFVFQPGSRVSLEMLNFSHHLPIIHPLGFAVFG